jgi:hypothetical protein
MLAAIGVLSVVLVVSLFYGTQSHQEKPIILYVNQGNGAVDTSNFGAMLTFASSRGFNTIFFQIYRQGALLFDVGELSGFVNRTHSSGQRIFFALYITNSTQKIPPAIFGLGEDGVSLDMSSMDLASQEGLLAALTSTCACQTAVTTTDLTSTLKPDLLVLETYSPASQQYIRQGVVASVGVFATTSEDDFQAQIQYALSNSDGVMVFDYAGLVKSGYTTVV